MKMKNLVTGELAPIEVIGWSVDDYEIIKRIDGWDLVRDNGDELPIDFQTDADGNYVLKPKPLNGTWEKS